MSRIKERPKFIHKPSTQEIFISLSDMPVYSKILLDNGTNKEYKKFLNWLIQIDFYNHLEDRIPIKKIASDFKTDASKATRWIRQIYDDIFELNYEKPHQFYKEGYKVILYARDHDNACFLCVSLPFIPREYEELSFYFIKAKMGISNFWVRKVDYVITKIGIETTIYLEGGHVNKYRQQALDKAMFHGWLNFSDIYEKSQYEIDNELRRIYK